MRAGALRNFITIEVKSQVATDALNAPVYEWVTHAECFCSKTTRRGAEMFDPTTKQRYPQTMVQFVCRYGDVVGLTADMRIVHEGQIYDIRNIMPDDDRKVDVVIVATLQDGAVGGAC